MIDDRVGSCSYLSFEDVIINTTLTQEPEFKLSISEEELKARVAKLSLIELSEARELYRYYPWPDGYVPPLPVELTQPVTAYRVWVAIAAALPLAVAALFAPTPVGYMVGGVVSAWWVYTQVRRLQRASGVITQQMDYPALTRYNRTVALAAKVGLPVEEYTSHVNFVMVGRLHAMWVDAIAAVEANPSDAKAERVREEQLQVAAWAKSGTPRPFSFVDKAVVAAAAVVAAKAAAIEAARPSALSLRDLGLDTARYSSGSSTYYDQDDVDYGDYGSPYAVNPANGLPMIGGSMIDVGGHVYGTNDD